MSRMDKVNELIKREIGHLFLSGEISDPRVQFVTILSVDVSKDLHHARVKFSLLSDNIKEIEGTTDALNHMSGYIRKLIGGKIQLRFTPEIQFIFDKSVQHAALIDQKIEEIKQLKEPHDG